MRRLTRSGLVALLLLCASLDGCSGARSGTSATSNVSGCAAVLPLARAAVRGRGTLVLLTRVKAAQADRIVTEVTGHPPTPAPSPTPRGPRPRASHGLAHLPSFVHRRTPSDCLVVWRGPYPLGAVPLAVTSSGRFALVLLRVRHPVVTRVLVTDRLPRDARG